MKELAGKTVFVTGAASGIGLGIATAFAQAGAKVMLCDIEEAALSAALKQLRLTNVDVDGVKADVSLKAELVAAAEATMPAMARCVSSSTTRASAAVGLMAPGPRRRGTGPWAST